MKIVFSSDVFLNNNIHFQKHIFKYSIIGQWSHGECTLAAVGATNVGSIVTCLEPDFQTNVSGHYWQYIRSKTSRVKSYQPLVLSTRGDEMAQFQLGLFTDFQDVYMVIVIDLMEMDLHRIIYSISIVSSSGYIRSF